MFPQGLAGAGLLLMRVSCALAAAAAIPLLAPMPPCGEAGPLVLAGGILLGLCTRVAALAGAALSVVVFLRVSGSLALAVALMALVLVALAMTGPGAYSIDARLFGRKVITLRRPDSGLSGE